MLGHIIYPADDTNSAVCDQPDGLIPSYKLAIDDILHDSEFKQDATGFLLEDVYQTERTILLFYGLM